jgi:spermidine/putrescine ABC transporter ATP-binding subunit
MGELPKGNHLRSEEESVNEVEVELLELTKNFGNVQAVKDVSLQIKKGEFFFLLGPSGCGKTTTLRMVAGFEKPDAGLVKIKGQVVNRILPEKRNTGMVFQNWALFPHKTVFENIAFGLKMRRFSKEVIREKVLKALDLIHMPDFGNRYPHELSGGQRQRVALARALVIEPSVLLLDEPLSNLDAKIREKMRLEISLLLKRLGMTAIYVTHDQSEALAMADRIAVMDDGVIVQVGTPIEIYESPSGEFVADFIGDSNCLVGEVTETAPPLGTFVSNQGLKLEVPIKEGWKPGEQHKIFLRPEKLRLSSSPPTGPNRFQGTVKHITYMGSSIRYQVEVEGLCELRVDEQNLAQTPSFETGDRVYLSCSPYNCCCFRCPEDTS